MKIPHLLFASSVKLDVIDYIIMEKEDYIFHKKRKKPATPMYVATNSKF